MTSRQHSQRPRGSSLLLVLWAIMLMSFAIIGLVRHLDSHLDDSIIAAKQFRARHLLQSARTLADHPAISRGDPLLHQQLSPTESYQVTISSEGVRLAVNQLATSGTQRRFASRLFESWGLDAKAARSLTDAIADWIDADATPRTHGAELDAYLPLDHPDFPHNRPFSNLDDLLLVRDFSLVDHLQPDWRRWFTLFGDGSIDLHLAPPDLLAILFDVTIPEVSRFTTARLGPDGIDVSIDDPAFSSIKEVRALLDVPEPNFKEVAPILTLHHPVRRTECLATVGNLERRLTVLQGPGIYLVREE